MGTGAVAAVVVAAAASVVVVAAVAVQEGVELGIEGLVAAAAVVVAVMWHGMQFDFVTGVDCVESGVGDEADSPDSDTRTVLVDADTAGRRLVGSAERPEPGLALKLRALQHRADSESPVAGAAASAVRTADCCKEPPALEAPAEAVEVAAEAVESFAEAVKVAVEAVEPFAEAVEPCAEALEPCAEAVEVAAEAVEPLAEAAVVVEVPGEAVEASAAAAAHRAVVEDGTEEEECDLEAAVAATEGIDRSVLGIEVGGSPGRLVLAVVVAAAAADGVLVA